MAQTQLQGPSLAKEFIGALWLNAFADHSFYSQLLAVQHRSGMSQCTNLFGTCLSLPFSG